MTTTDTLPTQPSHRHWKTALMLVAVIVMAVLIGRYIHGHPFSLFKDCTQTNQPALTTPMTTSGTAHAAQTQNLFTCAWHRDY